MFLIDKPYVSDFLIDTLRKNQFPVIATDVAKSMIHDNDLCWIDESQAVEVFQKNPDTAFYSNSENALAWIDEHLQKSHLNKKINALKDKVKFREMISSVYPEFYFRKIKIQDIAELKTDDLPFPFVIKPSIGFFSIGVHVVKNKKDWVNAKAELNPEKLKSIFPVNVLDSTYFIIEEFIQGEEYAIDYYYNDKGKAVILNILHHLFASESDTSDRVYSTSKILIEKYEADIKTFLNRIGSQLELKNFPAHAEVIIKENGQIVPIEINPLRFGGWCTTGDLLGECLGFNSYQHYLQNKKPNWNEIFSNKETKIFSLIVLDNNSGIDVSEIESFDYSKLKSDFEKPVVIRTLDINDYPVFGFVFSETNPDNQNELTNILTSNLKKYIITKS